MPSLPSLRNALPSSLPNGIIISHEYLFGSSLSMRCCNCTRAREHHRLRSARFLRRVVKSRYAAGKRKQVSQTLRSDNLSPVTLKHSQPIHARPSHAQTPSAQPRSNTLSPVTLKHPQASHAQTPSAQARSNTLSPVTLKHPQPESAQPRSKQPQPSPGTFCHWYTFSTTRTHWVCAPHTSTSRSDTAGNCPFSRTIR